MNQLQFIGALVYVLTVFGAAILIVFYPFIKITKHGTAIHNNRSGMRIGIRSLLASPCFGYGHSEDLREKEAHTQAPVKQKGIKKIRHQINVII